MPKRKRIKLRNRKSAWAIVITTPGGKSERWIPVAEAAKIADVSRTAIYKRINAGDFETKSFPGVGVCIFEDELRNYIAGRERRTN